MKKLLVPLVVALAATCAFAQSGSSGVTVSTDPARAAAVERRAQELKARPVEQAPVVHHKAKATKHPAKKHAAKKH